MQFSSIFNSLMNSKGITAYKMSKETGISDSLIGYWRKGERVPSAENLILISKYLGISIDYLLTGRKTEPEPTSELTEEDKSILSFFHELSDETKIHVLAIISMLAKSDG